MRDTKPRWGNLIRLGLLDPTDLAQAKQEIEQWKLKVEGHAILPWMQGLDAEIPSVMENPDKPDDRGTIYGRCRQWLRMKQLSGEYKTDNASHEKSADASKGSGSLLQASLTKTKPKGEKEKPAAKAKAKATPKSRKGTPANSRDGSVETSKEDLRASLLALFGGQLTGAC